jgi:hypothetical protein
VQEILGNKHFWLPVMFIFVFGLPLFAGVVGFFWYRLRRLEISAALKHEMLERGMSADDICKVLEAGTQTAAAEDKDLLHCLSGQAPRVAVIRVPRAGS